LSWDDRAALAQFTNIAKALQKGDLAGLEPQPQQSKTPTPLFLLPATVSVYRAQYPA
jgi:hypothetical protein